MLLVCFNSICYNNLYVGSFLLQEFGICEDFFYKIGRANSKSCAHKEGSGQGKQKTRRIEKKNEKKAI